MALDTKDLTDNQATDTAKEISSDILSYLGNSMEYIKPVLTALAIIIIGGWIIKKIMKVVHYSLNKAKVDTVMTKLGVSEQLESLGIKITVSALITGIISIVAKFVLWMAAIDILGIEALSKLMADIVAFLPNVLIAIVLLFAGLTISKLAKEAVEKSASNLSVKEPTTKLFAKITKVSILTITIMAVLVQLNIAADLVKVVFTGVVTALTIAGGLAFGLGGKDKAKELISKL